ncbi:glycoside hydrolase family 47 protein [Xylariaceae sp. FL0594]|nr:glycoside hydrolase family 47 protein [Xylariaceae sp. FL0594]
MAVRRVRVILGVILFWVLATWYFKSSQRGGAGLFDSASVTGQLRWKRLADRHKVDQLATIPTNKPVIPIPPIQAPRPQEDKASRDKRFARLTAVRNSFLHSWEGYKKYAWGHDEIKPLSGASKDPFGGWAATLVDSLDTLWLLELKDEFDKAVKACDEIDFSTTQSRDINVFETTIRYLGGFLAAYELSEKQYPSLLNKSTELANLLMTAFDTPNRMPISRFNWREYMKGSPQRAPATTLLAEIGSLSLEMTKMSQLTGDMQYYDAIKRIYDELEAGQLFTEIPGLWPVLVDASKTPMRFKGDSFTLGGMSDSTYEYLGKHYLLLGGASEQPRRLYERFIPAARNYLLQRALNPGNQAISFMGDARMASQEGGELVAVTAPRTQHLTCFAGGMVGLGAKLFDRPFDLKVAEELTDGCVWAYASLPSGIAPEIFYYIPCSKAKEDEDDCRWSDKRWYDEVKKYWAAGEEADTMTDDKVAEIVESQQLPQGMIDVYDRRYQLRPEAIESVFYMYRLTGDAKWMDKAWDMFQAIEKHTRTAYAAAALRDVTMTKPEQVDSMESFWLAETLKYFYLMFGDWELFDLDKWVLNTEAHPLRRAEL